MLSWVFFDFEILEGEARKIRNSSKAQGRRSITDCTAARVLYDDSYLRLHESEDSGITTV